MGHGFVTPVILADTTVKICGFNTYGQCGLGSTSPANVLTHTLIPGLTGVKQVSCGDTYVAFLMEDGSVKTVGYNTSGQCGTGNTTSPQLSLYTIPGLTGVKQIACGNNHTVCLMSDGTVKTVGKNDYGQCGTGNTTSPQLSLYTIPNLTGVKQVACGYAHSVFLMSDGSVKTVGYNISGQCGTGNTTTPQLSLYTIPGLTGVKQVACGAAYTVFIMNDGTVKTVGDNGFGQCGTGATSATQLSLYTVPGLTGVKQASCGDNYVVFLLNDSTVKTLGQNTYGQCGTGNTTSPQLSLYTIPGLTGVKQVMCGQYHSVFLMSDGSVKTLGYNSEGECGTGGTSTQLSLYTIPSLTGKSLWDASLSPLLLLLYSNSKYYSPTTFNELAGELNASMFETYGVENISTINLSTFPTAFEVLGYDGGGAFEGTSTVEAVYATKPVLEANSKVLYYTDSGAESFKLTYECIPQLPKEGIESDSFDFLVYKDTPADTSATLGFTPALEKYDYSVSIDNPLTPENPDLVLTEVAGATGIVDGQVTVPADFVATLNPYPVKVAVEQLDNTVVEGEASITLYNTAPFFVKGVINSGLVGIEIDDNEHDFVQFKMLLNGTQIYPEVGEWSSLVTSPYTYNVKLGSKDIILGELNSLDIIARDEFGTQSSSLTLTFIGTYNGLLFMDAEGKYYSTDDGSILKKLDFGTLIGGQTSMPKTVYLENRTGFEVENVAITAQNEVAANVYAELSETEMPFNPVSNILIPSVMVDGEVKPFYIRVRTTKYAHQGGDFSIDVSGDPVVE